MTNSVSNNGFEKWHTDRGYLTDTCLAVQDKYKKWLEYF